MKRPAIFIGSSREAMDVAYALQKQLEYEADPTVWDQGVFRPMAQTLADLVAEARATDFAAFIFAPDDLAEIRASAETSSGTTCCSNWVCSSVRSARTGASS